MKKTTQYNTCPDCGAHLDPSEVCDCKKKTASSGDTLKAEAAAIAKELISKSISENDDFVNCEFREEIGELFALLSPEGKHRVTKFVKLSHRDPDFSAAFDARFGNIETRDYEEVGKFINGWKAVAV